jgi:hypothetical protein
MHFSKSASSSCCHIRITTQLRRRSLRKLRTSRARFAAILICQNGGSLCRHLGKLKPCQKSPSMNTTVRCFAKAMSGRPGSDRTCVRNRKPRLCSAARTRRSSGLSVLLTRDMHRRRASVERLSKPIYCDESVALIDREWRLMNGGGSALPMSLAAANFPLSSAILYRGGNP